MAGVWRAMWAEAKEKTLESSSRAVGLGSRRKMSGEIMVVAKAAAPLLPRDHGRGINIDRYIQSIWV